MSSEVDVRHRAYEIAQHIADGSLTRLDYVDSTTLIHETGQCLKHLLGLVGDLEADAAGLEVEIEEANDKIAEQAQELADLRREVHQLPILGSELKRANIKLGENDRELAKLRNRILLSPSQDDLAGFAARESGVKAAEQYLKKSRRSYLTGAVSAVGDLVRLVRGGWK